MKKKIILGSIILFSLLLLIIYLKKPNENHKITQNPGYTIPRTVRYGFSINNTSNILIKNGIFKTYAPVKKTAFQTCNNIAASHHFSIKDDIFGNRILVFNLGPIPPYGSKIINITAELLLSNTPNSLPEKDLNIWLKPEKYIESDNQKIIKTAYYIKGATTEKTAEKILNLVADHITYSGYIKNARGALYAFKEKKGDCTEYMYLFTALARAAGIPSRGIGGYVVTGNTILNSAGYHNWSEFYDHGKWQVADPQKRVFMKNGNTYIAMKIMTPREKSSKTHFERFYIEGKGLTVKMN